MDVKKEIEQIDKAIGELIYPKTALQKAYNYYHGIRDADQFKHIEENYGIGTPTSITFNPLVRPHIDRLIGEYLGLNQDLKITCKDDETVTNIMHEKQVQINKEVYDYLKKYLENNIIASIINNQENKNDPFIEERIQKIINNINDSFVSQYEIAAQNILDYLKQSKNIDLDNKMHSLLTDLCVTGTCYYRVRPSNSGDNVQFEVLNPLNTFVEKNPNSNYLADSYRVVVRRYMSVEDILLEYRRDLKEEHIKILKEKNKSTVDSDGPTYYVRATTPELAGVWNSTHTGILGGLETHPIWPGETSRVGRYSYPNLWTVYDVEWIEVDYKTGKQSRHEGTKIGSDIYITRGESENVIRTKDNPNKVRLSVNGLFFLDENGQPNSMILKTRDLQDKYDLLAFYRDNLIASSGTIGNWVDVANLPVFLGDTLPERLQKWQAYVKQGLGLIDSSQEGDKSALNTIFNGFDNTVKAESINAINVAMQAIQQQVSMVTGVLPEALAQYEQRDAVSNVQLGVKTTMLLTKQIFKAMDTVYKEANYDMLNLAKIVWPKGVTGTIVLGNYSKIFSALPKYYTLTDFDIHIEDSTKSYQNVQSLIAMSGELVKSGAADLGDITNIITANGMTELKRAVDKSIARKKEENDTVNQLQQQIQQYEQNAQEMQKTNKELQSQIEELQNKLQSANEEKMNIENQKVAIEKEKVKNDKDYNDKIAEVKQRQVDAQIAEMFDGNPYNNKIKQV